MDPNGNYTGFGLTPAQQNDAPKKPHLYIGNLSPRVTDYMLTEIFAVAGPVVQAKIIQDKNFSHAGFNYGFVEYADMRSAEQALTTLNGRKIFDAEVRVNWAYQNQAKEDTQHHYHVFVGDLSPEVNDEVLSKAFGAFGTMSEARVMWDMNTGKSRGYGFLSFREKPDAEQAIQTMNGEWLGSRAIRVNWANQKTQTGRVGGAPGPGGPSGPGGGSPNMGGGMGMPPPMGGGMSPMGYAPPPRANIAAQPMAMPMGGMGNNSGGHGGMGGMSHHSPAPGSYHTAPPLPFDQVLLQTPEYNTTVYVGNLIPYTTQADLIPLFQGYGYIVEIRMQADRGFAFIKLDTHQNAALAITQLSNQLVHGRPIKCSWGKDKAPDGHTGPAAGGQPQAQTQTQPGQYPMMNYPNYYNYNQQYTYAQQGVPGQPGQQSHNPPHNGSAHTPTSGAPQFDHSHQSSLSPAPHQATPAAAASQAQQSGGWDQAAQAAYYQTSGWGGYYAPQDGAANGQGH